MIERLRRLRRGAGLRWWIFGAFLLSSSYLVRRWLAASRAQGHSVPFPWLGLLLAAGHGSAAILILALIGERSGSSEEIGKRQPSPWYPCPSCGFLVFSEPPGGYEICRICGWEDDPVQLADPTYSGGANRESLSVSQNKILQSVPAKVVEHHGYRRDPQWRPLRDQDLLKAKDGEETAYYWLRDRDS